MKEKLQNIGPKSAAWLRQVGIHQRAELAELGAVDAFIKVKRAGFRPSLNLLYALEGALCDCHWQALSAERREQLAIEAGEASVDLPPARGKKPPAAGPVTLISGSVDDSDIIE